MKIALKSVQKNINLKDISKKIANFVNKKETLVIFLIFLIFIIYTGYLWYAYAYNYQWDETRKQEYMSTKSAANSFDEAKFEKVLDAINARQDSYQKNVDNVKDIFRLK
jgi:hypothetical protein